MVQRMPLPGGQPRGDIDSAGCFEVVAQAWSLVPEERIE